MNNNSLNHTIEYQRRHQDMLRKAERERSINNILRLRKNENNRDRSFITRLQCWWASHLGGKPNLGHEQAYASPSQKK